MSRELKRVPLTFNWPIGRTWGGYVNPFQSQSENCPHCQHGYSPTATILSDQWYGYSDFKPEDRGSTPYLPTDKVVRNFAERNVSRSPEYYGQGEYVINKEAIRLCNLFNAQWNHHLDQEDVNALVEAERLMDFTHTWSRENGWVEKSPKYIPTAKEVNDWSISGMGHDSCNSYVCIKAACKKLGVSTTCEHCQGSATVWPSEEIKKQCEDWKETEPPTGEGYQLWQTVSEGSPISPVFATADELAEWLATSDEYTWKRNDEGTTKEQWMKFILGDGWSPSFVMINGEVKTGVQAL